MAVNTRSLGDSLETVSIVLVGLFQVNEFEPSNLLSLGSIDAKELAVGKVALRLPDAFAIQYPTLHINVEQTKVQIVSTVEEPVFEKAQEFALSFFSASKGHSAT